MKRCETSAFFSAGNLLSRGSRVQKRQRRTAPVVEPLDVVLEVEAQLLPARRVPLLLQRDP